MPNAMFEGGSSSTYTSPSTVTTPAGTTLPSNYGSAPKKTTAKKKTTTSSTSSKKASSASSSNYSSGGDSGYSSSSTGSNSTGQVSTLAAPPPVPSIPTTTEFLGKDSTYLGQVAALNKALADYRAQMGQSQGQYNTDYASRVNDLNINREQGLVNQAEDFASRGMYTSGVYGHDRSDLLGQFSRRQADMDTARANFLSGLQSDYSNFQGDQGITLAQARQDALARRAAQYGLTSV